MPPLLGSPSPENPQPWRSLPGYSPPPACCAPPGTGPLATDARWFCLALRHFSASLDISAAPFCDVEGGLAKLFLRGLDLPSPSHSWIGPRVFRLSSDAVESETSSQVTPHALTSPRSLTGPGVPLPRSSSHLALFHDHPGLTGASSLKSRPLASAIISLEMNVSSDTGAQVPRL